MSFAFQWNVVIPKSGPKSDSRSTPALQYKVLVCIRQFYRQGFTLHYQNFHL